MSKTGTFFDIAKPEWTPEDITTQVGCHFEEFSELCKGLGYRKDFDLLYEVGLHSEIFKTRSKVSSVKEMEDWNKTEILDALVDSYVTGYGICKALGMNFEGALAEVEASNLSKFEYVGEDEITPEQLSEFASICNSIEDNTPYKNIHWQRKGNYVVFYDGNGKIMKSPKTYFEPELSKFI